MHERKKPGEKGLATGFNSKIYMQNPGRWQLQQWEAKEDAEKLFLIAPLPSSSEMEV